LGTAALEPNTRYIWGAIDAADYEPAQSFTTGPGPKAAVPFPAVEVEVTAVRPSVGGGDCAAIKEGTVEVTVSATSEPWIFLPENTNDLPARIEGGTTEFKWGTIDAATCFGIQQINWAGEIVDTDVDVCVPEPLDAGPDGDSFDGSANSDVTTNDVSASADATTDAAADFSNATSEPILEPSPTDAGTPQPDAEKNALVIDESGCSCRTVSGTSSPAAGWAGLVLVGLIGRRRRRS
jgi:MYXO-CTERM domain-containing protein